MTRSGLRFAIHFLRANAGIKKELLPFSLSLINLHANVGEAMRNHITAAEEKALQSWQLAASA